MHEDGHRSFRVAGYVDEDLNVHMASIKDAEMVPGPVDLPPDSVAVRCRTARSVQDMIDGWLLYIRKPGTLLPDIIGRLCVVGKNEDQASVAFVNRGYKNGTYNLTPWRVSGGKSAAMVENVTLEWASPVLWIRP